MDPSQRVSPLNPVTACRPSHPHSLPAGVGGGPVAAPAAQPGYPCICGLGALHCAGLQAGKHVQSAACCSACLPALLWSFSRPHTDDDGLDALDHCAPQAGKPLLPLLLLLLKSYWPASSGTSPAAQPSPDSHVQSSSVGRTCCRALPFASKAALPAATFLPPLLLCGCSGAGAHIIVLGVGAE